MHFSNDRRFACFYCNLRDAAATTAVGAYPVGRTFALYLNKCNIYRFIVPIPCDEYNLSVPRQNGRSSSVVALDPSVVSIPPVGFESPLPLALSLTSLSVAPTHILAKNLCGADCN